MRLDWDSLRRLSRPKAPVEPAHGLLDLAIAARRELEAAQAQFDEVHDPDLVDHAIFRLHAAERHYVFLLREAGR